MASKPSGIKRSKKSLSLKQKYEIIQLSEHGLTNSEIGRKLDLARQTISTIVCGKERILNEIKRATPVNSKLIRKHASLSYEMENLLVMWFEDQASHNIPINTALIKNKAISLFQALKTKRGDEASHEKFEASNGWFYRFKERNGLHNIRTKGDAASATVGAAKLFPAELVRGVSPITMIKVGSKFYTFDELIRRLDEFQRLENVQLFLSDSRTISSSARRSLRKSLNPLLKYSEIIYSCVLKGQPLRNLKSAAPENCPFKVCLIASGDGRSLFVSQICYDHNHGKIGYNSKLNHSVAMNTEICVDRNAETEAAKELIEFSHKAVRKRKNSESSNSSTKKVKENTDCFESPFPIMNTICQTVNSNMSPVVVLKNVEDFGHEKPILSSESCLNYKSKLMCTSNQLIKSKNFVKQNVVDVVSRKLNITPELSVNQNTTKELSSNANSLVNHNLINELTFPKIHAKTVAQINLEPENEFDSEIKLEPRASNKDIIISEHNSNKNTVVQNSSFPNATFSFESGEPISFINSQQKCSSRNVCQMNLPERPIPRVENQVTTCMDHNVNDDTLQVGNHTEIESNLDIKIENVFRTNDANFESNKFHEDGKNLNCSPKVNVLSVSDIYIGKGYSYHLFYFKCDSCKVSFNLEKDFIVHNRSPIHYKATMAERQSNVSEVTFHSKLLQKIPTLCAKNNFKNNYKTAVTGSIKGPNNVNRSKPANKSKLLGIDQKPALIKISNAVPMKNPLQPVHYMPLNLIKRRIVIIGDLEHREEFLKEQKLKAKVPDINKNNYSNNNNNKCDLPIMFLPYQVKVKSAETGEFKFVVMYLPHFDTETSSKIMKDCWNIPDNSWIGEVDEPVRYETKFQFNHSSSAAMDEIKVDKVLALVNDGPTLCNMTSNVHTLASNENTISTNNIASSAMSQNVNILSLKNNKSLPLKAKDDFLNLKVTHDNCSISSVSDDTEVQLGKKQKRVSWKDQSSNISSEIKLPFHNDNTESCFTKKLDLSSVQPSMQHKDNKDSVGSVTTAVPGSVSKKLDLYIDSLISNNVNITGLGPANKLPVSPSKREHLTFMTQVPRENYLICQRYLPTETKTLSRHEQRLVNNVTKINTSLIKDKAEINSKSVLSSLSPVRMSPKFNDFGRIPPSANINKLISNPSPGTPNSIKIKPSEFQSLKIPILKLKRIRKLNSDVKEYLNSSVKDEVDAVISVNRGSESETISLVNLADTTKFESHAGPFLKVKSPSSHLGNTKINSELIEISDHLLNTCIADARKTDDIANAEAVNVPKSSCNKEVRCHNTNSGLESDHSYKSKAKRNKSVSSENLKLVKHLEENSKFISALLADVDRSNIAAEDEYDHMPIFHNVERLGTELGKLQSISTPCKLEILSNNSKSTEFKSNDCDSLSPIKSNKQKLALINKVLDEICDNDICIDGQKKKQKIDIIEKVSCDASCSNVASDSVKNSLGSKSSFCYEMNVEDSNCNADLSIVADNLRNGVSEEVVRDKLIVGKFPTVVDEVLENMNDDCNSLSRVGNIKSSVIATKELENKLVFPKTKPITDKISKARNNLSEADFNLRKSSSSTEEDRGNSSEEDFSLEKNKDSAFKDFYLVKDKGNSEEDLNLVAKIDNSSEEDLNIEKDQNNSSEKDLHLECNLNEGEVNEVKLLSEANEITDCFFNEDNNSVNYISLLNAMDYNEPLSAKSVIPVLELEQPEIFKEEIAKIDETNPNPTDETVSFPLYEKSVSYTNVVSELNSEDNMHQNTSSTKLGLESSLGDNIGIIEKLEETNNNDTLIKTSLESNKEKANISKYSSSLSVVAEIESVLSSSQHVVFSEGSSTATPVINVSQMKRSFSGTILKVKRHSLHQSIIKNSDVIRRSDSPTVRDENFKDRIIKASRVLGLDVKKIDRPICTSEELTKNVDEIKENVINIKTSVKDSFINEDAKTTSISKLDTPVGKQKSEDNDAKFPKTIMVSCTSKNDSIPIALTPKIVEITNNSNQITETSNIQVINADNSLGSPNLYNMTLNSGISDSTLKPSVTENSEYKCPLEVRNNTDTGLTKSKLCPALAMEPDTQKNKSLKSKFMDSSSSSTLHSSSNVFELLNEESLNRFHYKDSDSEDKKDSKFEEDDCVDKLRENSTPGDNLSIVDENEWQENLANFDTVEEDGYTRLLQNIQ